MIKLDFSIDYSITDKIQQVSSRFDLSYWRGIDSERQFPHEYWNSLANAGLFGIIVEKRWQGMEKGILDLYLAIEETSERFSGLGSYL